MTNQQYHEEQKSNIVDATTLPSGGFLYHLGRLLAVAVIIGVPSYYAAMIGYPNALWVLAATALATAIFVHWGQRKNWLNLARGILILVFVALPAALARIIVKILSSFKHSATTFVRRAVCDRFELSWCSRTKAPV